MKKRKPTVLCHHPASRVIILMGSGGYEWCLCGALKDPGSKHFTRPSYGQDQAKTPKG